MTYKVKFTHSDKSHAHITSAIIREGREGYRHPRGRFVVPEFQGESGKYRNTHWMAFMKFPKGGDDNDNHT